MDKPLIAHGGAAVHPVAGWAAVTLSVGEASFTLVPELSVVGVALVWRGHAVVAPHRPLTDYATGGHTLGVPLLHPWANRLGADRVEVRDPGTGQVSVVDVDAAVLLPAVGRDAAGLALHGTMAARPGWVVRSVQTGPDFAAITSTYDVAADLVQMACFPFPHELAVAHHLSVVGDSAVLRTSVTVTATGDVSVPLCLGWHPYLRLPNSPRNSWRLEMPELDHLGLGPDLLPTGGAARQPGQDAVLGDRTFDDGYRFVDDAAPHSAAANDVDMSPRRILSISDDHVRVAMEAGQGFTHVQVYAPRDVDVVALEPMAAAADALRTGDHAWVHPGESASLWFTLRVGRSQQAA